MRILVTGYKGFIGQHMSNYFLHKGHEVEGFDYVENIVPDVKDYDWVIHCGAISDTTETDIDKVWAHNLEFTQRLLQVCDHFGTNLQYASSASVYGPLKEFKEDSPCLPQSPYAWSKYLFDRTIQEVGANNFSCIVQGFRYFNVYGPGEGHKKDQQSLVSKFTEQAVHQKVIKLFEGSDKFLRDCVSVYDVVATQDAMMKVDESGIWNLGTSKAISVEEVAKIIAKKHNAEIEYIPMPEHLKGQYQEYTCADNTKLHNTIPIRNWMTIEEYFNAHTD